MKRLRGSFPAPCAPLQPENRSRVTMAENIRAALLVAFSLLMSGIQAQSWSVAFKGIGTFSSPRVTDLNGDGIGDIVFGAGREEFMRCDSAVIALDGASGKMLWNIAASDQIFGSPAFMDINGDHVDDVFIGGRSAELIAINGKTGKVIWRFDRKKGKHKWYNFYNPQFIRDQDGDGLPDILISNGGNVLAEPYDSRKRYPGYLVVISSRDGRALAQAAMPDKKETYMSVVACAIPGQQDYQIIFGTGGETVGGHLYLCTLSDVLKGDLSAAIMLDSSPDKGYIGPGVWVDITGDDVPDVVANAVEGKLVAFNGITYEKIWSVKIPHSEAYSSIAPGYFNTDEVPDFFVSYAIGQWPKLEWSKQIMVDGATGSVAYMDSLGFYQTSSPVVVDLDGNGRDEALLSVNIHIYDELNRRALYNMIVSLEFDNNTVHQFTDPLKGSNISSTPWIGDLDGDNFLDLVYCHGTNTNKSYTFDGLQINRVATQIPMRGGIRWGGYMGSNYDGVWTTPANTPLNFPR